MFALRHTQARLVLQTTLTRTCGMSVLQCRWCTVPTWTWMWKSRTATTRSSLTSKSRVQRALPRHSQRPPPSPGPILFGDVCTSTPNTPAFALFLAVFCATSFHSLFFVHVGPKCNTTVSRTNPNKTDLSRCVAFRKHAHMPNTTTCVSVDVFQQSDEHDCAQDSVPECGQGERGRLPHQGH